jgi:hypothetical protein
VLTKRHQREKIDDRRDNKIIDENSAIHKT